MHDAGKGIFVKKSLDTPTNQPAAFEVVLPKKVWPGQKKLTSPNKEEGKITKF